MNFPRVSIVTPSFNQAQFLEKTILSVINQDYPNIEYIVIDGGSTDGSQEIIKKYEDKITHWVSEKDNGQSDAINKGFRKCTGEIVAWINSDDLYVDGAISRIVKFLAGHPDVDMVHGDLDFIDSTGKVLFNIKSRDFTLQELMVKNRVSQPATFWKRKIFDEIGYLDENRHYIMDYDFWVRAAMKFNVRHIDATIARFRLHGESKTVSNSDLFLIENLIMLDQLLSSYRHRDDVARSVFQSLPLLLPGFRFTHMADVHRYIDKYKPQMAGKVLGLAEYRSTLLDGNLRLSDFGTIKNRLRRFLLDYIGQYDDYERYITDRMIDRFANDEMFTAAQYLFDKGQTGKSLKLFLMLICLDTRHLEYRNVKELLKKYVLEGRAKTVE